ncbi:MAG: cyclic nucleotide-binding domain-containing protein [Dehalococcoidia bacterium]|nr:cyclic nucleotide-binding domain-containing protein [Dehalococcoidia bacterium]
MQLARWPSQTLRQCQVFSALNDDDLREAVHLAEQKEYGAGKAIFQVGMPAEELLVLQEGKVALQMSLSASGRGTSHRITVDIAGCNDLIGWSALVEPHVYTLTAVCIKPAKVLSINAIKLRALLNANHHTGYLVLNKLIKVVASRLDDTRQVLASERL